MSEETNPYNRAFQIFLNVGMSRLDADKLITSLCRTPSPSADKLIAAAIAYNASRKKDTSGCVVHPASQAIYDTVAAYQKESE